MFNRLIQGQVLKYFLIISLVVCYGCGGSADDEVEFNNLEVITNDVSNISVTSAILNGRIPSDGGSPITNRGFYFSDTPGVSSSSETFSVGTGTGSFSYSLNGLAANTNYYYRAFGHTDAGNEWGEEKSFTTLPTHEIFSTTDKLDYQMVHNKKDNIIYLWTYDAGSPLSNFKLFAYNYEQDALIASKDIGLYNRAGIRSVGVFNGQSELYNFTLNTVEVLDPLNLNTIAQITLPNTAQINCVRQLDNYLFISCSTNRGTELKVFNRQTMTLVSEVVYVNMHQAAFQVYRDKNDPSIFNVMSIPRSSSFELVTVHSFNENGEFIDSVTNTSDSYFNGSKLRTHEDVDFVLRGRYGTIFNKSEYTEIIFNNEFEFLNNQVELVDYRIDDNGNAIYSIQNDYKINKYSVQDFSSIGQIDITEKGNHLFIDGNELIVIEFTDNYPNETKVFITFYPLF